MIDSSDPDNYIDKMYYLKVFIVSFISANAVIYCYYHMGQPRIETTGSLLKKKKLNTVDFSKLTPDVTDSIQTGAGALVPEIMANLPDF
jgi:hypothetical protein